MSAGSYSAARVSEPKTFANGYVFGAPIKDLGFFGMLLMGFATGFIMFFASTFFGIVTVLFLNATGHTADYTIAYRLVGLPIGVLSAVLALGYLFTFWVKRITRSATQPVDR